MMGRFDGSGRGGRGGGRGYPNAGGGRDVSGVSPNSYAAQSAAEKEAALMPFLHPTPRVLVPVPLVFESPQHFCELIANNLLAEFWYLIQEGPRGPGLKATPSAGGRLRVGGDTAGDGDASLVHHLLLIDRRLHVVVQQTQGGVVNTGTGDKTPCVLTLKPKLAGPFVGPIRSFGYVGAFVAELSALRELSLRDNNGDAASPALRAMLSPNTAVLGNWHPPPLPEEDFALIAASRGAVKHSVGTTKKDKTSRGKVGLGASVVTRVTQHEIKNPNGTDVHAVAPGVDAVIAGADAKDANRAHDSDDDLLEKETPDDSRVTQPKTRKGVGANASQRAAVCALKWALEKIQGPPGTGKSTTIYHVITQRVPPGQRVLVTCSRNVAIESIAQKLETCSSEILVVGAPGRIGTSCISQIQLLFANTRLTLSLFISRRDGAEIPFRRENRSAPQGKSARRQFPRWFPKPGRDGGGERGEGRAHDGLQADSVHNSICLPAATGVGGTRFWESVSSAHRDRGRVRVYPRILNRPVA